VTVVGDITTMVADATNVHVFKEMPENGRSERKPAFRTHKGTCVDDAISIVTNGEKLVMDKDVDVAQASLDLVEGNVFRVAAIAFELHLTDDLVQRRAVGDTCLFVAADAGTTEDVDASALPRFATQSVRPEGLAAICAVQQPLVDPDVIDAHLLREKKHL